MLAKTPWPRGALRAVEGNGMLALKSEPCEAEDAVE
jgi:hypothetical protein